MKCKICQNSKDNIKHNFEEIMFGTGERFDYVECSNCGCLQLLDIPDDLSKYYPKEYSNFAPVKFREHSVLSKFLKQKKSEYLLGLNNNIFGILMNKVSEPGFVEKLRPAGIKLNDKILDLGAGNGDRLLRLSYRGFTNLLGTDPFIEKDIEFPNGLSILKKDINEIKDVFDFIMLNHSFEHMTNPREILVKLNTMLEIGGMLLIRIPVADSLAWREYKENWVALDPPRHIFLHTRKSIDILASACGFKLEKTIDDSLEYQFIGSEQLRRGMKSRDKDSYYHKKSSTIFSEEEIKAFKAKAKKVNKLGEGDASCFYLKKTKSID